MSPQIVNQYKNSELNYEEIILAVENEDKYLSRKHLFVGFLARSKVKKLLENGDISENQYDIFFQACLSFHKTGCELEPINLIVFPLFLQVYLFLSVQK